MPRTSRLRRLHVVEPSPGQHEPQEPSSSAPARVDEAPQPDSAGQADLVADLDARLSGMSVLLHMALRLMRSHDASPSRRR